MKMRTAVLQIYIPYIIIIISRQNCLPCGVGKVCDQILIRCSGSHFLFLISVYWPVFACAWLVQLDMSYDLRCVVLTSVENNSKPYSSCPIKRGVIPKFLRYTVESHSLVQEDFRSVMYSVWSLSWLTKLYLNEDTVLSAVVSECKLSVMPSMWFSSNLVPFPCKLSKVLTRSTMFLVAIADRWLAPELL
jgi:hypothetical protein